MHILQAGVTDERIPEWLRLKMIEWNLETLADVMRTDYVALRYLEIVTEENLKDFVTFLFTHDVYEYLRV